MYEDSIPHCASHYYQDRFATSHFATNTNIDNTSGNDLQDPQHPSSQDNLQDRELQRLHQHQLIIQFRLELNSLRTQIQQLELLKQQLMLQQQMMQPAEHAQLMDQFSKTTASLLRVGNPSHFGGEPSIPQWAINGDGVGTGIVGGGNGSHGGRGEGGYPGMHLMERLHEKLRSMTLQQHHHQQQEKQRQLQNGGPSEVAKGASRRQSVSNAGSTRRDPVRIEQMSLEAELRDLERRMRSIQLLG
ncbi:MAG: hypothetical protein J3Q66DRAFT_342261 [Benniella sp.]|nr:MAG: hypothetical protein J3Q66DRAFT_342261 [Benniella sp.]